MTCAQISCTVNWWVFINNSKPGAQPEKLRHFLMETMNGHITINPLAITIWRRLKIKYPNALVWVRMEEHYYTFSRDAIAVHSVSKIKLYPCFQEHWRCTIACERVEAVMKKMIKAGFQVALCDELQ